MALACIPGYSGIWAGPSACEFHCRDSQYIDQASLRAFWGDSVADERMRAKWWKRSSMRRNSDPADALLGVIRAALQFCDRCRASGDLIGLLINQDAELEVRTASSITPKRRRFCT